VAYSASYPMGTGDSFPGVKRQGREAGHSPVRLHGVVHDLLSTGTTFPFTVKG
jgi:hypothetical protein